MTRRINRAGLAHIKSWEGLRLTAYLDVAGILTIGYGSTGSHVRPGMKITEEQAEALLKKDLDRFEARVENYVKVPLSDNQFAALVSFDFNTGALHKSTLLKKLNAGDYKSVPGELMKWTKAKVNGKLTTVQGLVNRRTSEVGLWKSGAPSESSNTPAPKPAPPVGTPEPGFWAALFAAIARFFTKGK
jgi:lysozyme